MGLRTHASDALSNYVYRTDQHFSWKQIGKTNFEGLTVTRLELVSQKWRDSVWTHTLQIARPAKMRNPEFAFLFITGDGSGSKTLPILKAVAERAGCMAAVVTKVPNQALYGGKKEDALIAYTFDQYLKTKDETWPLLFPMAKSAVKAMDAVQEYARKEHKEEVKGFVTAGASKRGWTTWLSAAVDPRVKGMAPMVIDMLNMKAQTDWAEKVYGKQSEQIHDYTDLGLVGKMDDPDMIRLREWVDPYAYRTRYNIPKLLLLGTNDRYWTVDSLRHYWDDLPEPKLIFQTPNAGHDLGGGKEATETLAAFVQMIADKQPLPKVNWKADGEAEVTLSMSSNHKAKLARLWTADSTDRDFRNDRWSSRDLDVKSGSSQAEARVEKPARGYRAYMGELILTSPTGHDYRLSTAARVTPDSKP
ncbi:MAG: PhoPQ-activated pathogenicity-related family protein [Gemmataceae bacterium]|nr:PhoPQ-activated pathogenicity-related family protein [Gemmataceae bacterium]